MVLAPERKACSTTNTKGAKPLYRCNGRCQEELFHDTLVELIDLPRFVVSNTPQVPRQRLARFQGFKANI